MADLSKLFVVIGAKTDEFQSKMKDVSGTLTKVGAVMTGVGAAVSGAMLLSVKSYAQAGDEIAKMRAKTGFAAETLSELRYIAERSGTSLQGLETAIRLSQRRLVEASEGMASAQKSFERLGLSVEYLRSLSPEDQFWAILEALAALEDQNIKSTAAQELFGRSGTDLLPILAQGIEGIKKLRQATHDMGLAFDDAAATSCENFNDALLDLTKAIGGLKNEIAQHLIPTLLPLIEKGTSLVKIALDWTNANAPLVNTLVSVAFGLSMLATQLGPTLLMFAMALKFLPAVGGAMSGLLGPIGLLILGLSLLGIGIYLLIQNWEACKNGAIRAWTAIKDTIISAINTIIQWINALIGWMNAIPGVNIGTLAPIGRGMTSYSPYYPNFQHGGIVPGRIGAPALAMVHGGEAIIPPDFGGMGATVNVYVAGSVVTERELQRSIREALLNQKNRNVNTGF